VTLTFDGVKVNRRAKYLGQRSHKGQAHTLRTDCVTWSSWVVGKNWSVQKIPPTTSCYVNTALRKPEGSVEGRSVNRWL